MKARCYINFRYKRQCDVIRSQVFLICIYSNYKYMSSSTINLFSGMRNPRSATEQDAEKSGAALEQWENSQMILTFFNLIKINHSWRVATCLPFGLTVFTFNWRRDEASFRKLWTIQGSLHRTPSTLHKAYRWINVCPNISLLVYDISRQPESRRRHIWWVFHFWLRFIT